MKLTLTALLAITFSISVLVISGDLEADFQNCLAATKAEISYASNLTWWFDSQSIHVPELKHPVAVAYAKSTSEVISLVKCAVKYQVKISPRSGGHSYEAFCNEDDHLVIDVSRINHVTINKRSRTVTVGAGIRLGKLYYELGMDRFSFPAGSCPTVGLAGQLAAGGFGFLSRLWGLASDNVVQLWMVDWRGKLLEVKHDKNSDLYFALRGGGGGSYGIVTTVTLKIHPNPPLSTAFFLRWKNRLNLQEFFKTFFNWAPWKSTPETLSTMLLLGKSSYITGIYAGNDGAQGLTKILSDGGILDIGGSDNYELNYYTSKDLLEARAWIDNGEVHYGDRRDYQFYNVAPNAWKSLELPPYPVPVYPTWALIQNDSRVNVTPTNSMYSLGFIPNLETNLVDRDYMKYSSQMVTEKFGDDAIEAIETFFDKDGKLQLKPHGGHIDSVPVGDSGFPHRNVMFNIQHFSPYYPKGTHDPSGIDGQNEIYQKVLRKIEPYTNHMSYQGYCDILWTKDPSIYMPRYYGSNVKRLITTKRHYDPHDFFSNSQSTPLSYL